MGFNATRRYRDSKYHDIALLAIAAIIIVVLLAWAVGLF
jgi:hypothetical protein